MFSMTVIGMLGSARLAMPGAGGAEAEHDREFSKLGRTCAFSNLVAHMQPVALPDRKDNRQDGSNPADYHSN
jgi:hypothetical protein